MPLRQTSASRPNNFALSDGCGWVKAKSLDRVTDLKSHNAALQESADELEQQNRNLREELRQRKASENKTTDFASQGL